MATTLLDPQVFAERLTDVRRNSGFNKTQLSQLLDRHDGYVSWLESGDAEWVKAEMAGAIAEIVAGQGKLITDEWLIFRYLLGDPTVELRDLLRGRDSNPQPTGFLDKAA